MTVGLATVGTAAVLVRDDRFVPLAHWGEQRDLPGLLAAWDEILPQIERWAADEAAFAGAQSFAEADVRAPYRPGQVFCTGANYKKHVVGLVMGDPSMRTADAEAMSDDERRRKVEEMMDARAQAEPYCFIKLPSCVVGPRDAVVLPRNVIKPDWELELGVVIGKPARHVSAAQAMDHVAGFVVVNDVTAREQIFRRDAGGLGADWLSGKCFPTFLPFGPMIVPRQYVADPYDLTITLSVNGKVYQNESTRDMMVSIERQIAYLSDRVELMPGDVICTGSPYGNGSAFGVFLQPDDEMEGMITGLGTQRNRCVAEGAS
ncbi:MULTISPECIES: fumarylacetoacetate hydrolase family protein [unclassified Sphingobium]|uniref:fumarylacetoacetate hydrolase family protein n=1 Tax=unclassified Sphingobium TaxID=2611147 RepID=UPI00222599EF|nr:MULTISPECIES: fumarylacetoacetate hydrolase family protein [unclassified Sphingobium]MCW2382669.1 2-keto-4-pentenoate hydratase/2-oxohepta-3-ene-1,7-dioic acid hydratase in catechol pathway [Sphingobium sp. B2D3B]MCW2397158.1 2-keto-4-pentenoate hydratase/2-oxohepta-3-ene-1,7-dioic acid hydratase in catechol pathway [Sphingobium sp. B2D3C]